MATAYRINDQLAPHFITLTVIDWVDVFTKKEYKDVIVESFNYCIAQKGLKVYEFVIMSNHLHAIVSSEKSLSDVIRDFKKFTARKIIDEISRINDSRKEWMLNKFLYAGNRNSNNSKYQFWKQDYHAIQLPNRKMWEQKTSYIHLNPVKAGIVEKPEDYLYSSAGSYFNKKCFVNICME